MIDQKEQTVFYKLTLKLLEKRYFVLAITLAWLICGAAAWQKLPLEAFPDVANMQVRVITQVPGKAPEEVERLVTIPIEKEVNGIPHSRPPRSISIFGLSVVTIVFDDEANAYTARQQVLERIAHADVPENLQPELDPNASPVGEVFRYTVEGHHWTSMDKKEVQDWLLNRLFKSVDGIVDSTGFGGPTKIFLVELDPGRLRAFGLSQSQVAEAISTSNDSTGGSYILSNDQRCMVRGLGLIQSAKDLGNVVVASKTDGLPIRVKDVAQVKVTSAVRKGQVGLNDDDDVVEGILMMQRGDNPSRVIANLHEAWQDIVDQLPEGMHLEPLYDRTALVRRTVNTISHNVFEGVAFVVIILMIFLFQLRAALVCSVVIPLAILGACMVLKVLNIPANLLSLGAIDFGIIVDGAVVVIEAITSELSSASGSGDVRDGVCRAVSQVGSPVLCGTAIIALTFLPILSFEHVEGRLFKPLAVMMNLNLLCAFLATMLVVPIVAYLVFSKRPPKHRESPPVVLLEKAYRAVLPVVQNHAWKLLTFLLCLFLSVVLLVPGLGAEFIPELEEGNIWLTVTMLPPSITLERAVEAAHQIRTILKSYPESANVLSQIGAPDDGTDPNPYNLIEVLVDLKPQSEWRKQFATKEELVESMDREINKKVPGLVCNFSQYIKDSMEEAMSGVKNGEYAVKLNGPDIGTLERLADNISDIVQTVPGFADVAHDLLVGQPQLIVQIDRESAARYGITSSRVLDVVETSIGGKSITKIFEGERRFDVVLRLEKAYRDNPSRVGEISVTTPGGQSIPIKQVAKITQVNGANSILREGNKRRIAVYANIRGRDLGSAVLDAQRRIESEVKLPPGYSLSYAGEFERAKEAGEKLLFIIPVTLVLIFGLLYLALDSAALALLAMSAVPIAASVAIIVLCLSGTHLSVSSGVGMIALFGLSVQNAVIIVSRLRDYLKQGVGGREAMKRAAIHKMNAVIIAALVASVGLFPAAFSNAIGSQSQKPFATVIAFGILPATLLILIFLPALAVYCIRDSRPRINGETFDGETLDVPLEVGCSAREIDSLSANAPQSGDGEGPHERH